MADETNEARRFYRPAEVAEMLGVSRAYVYKLIEDGKIEAHRLGNLRAIRISKDSLEGFLDRCKEGGTTG